MLDKLGGVFAPRPTPGPHKLKESIPMVIILRNKLKYALNNKEVSKIMMKRLIQIDGKIRTDVNFPAGFMGKYLCNFNNIIFEIFKPSSFDNNKKVLIYCTCGKQQTIQTHS